MLGLADPAAMILNRDGRRGLARMPGIGSHLAYTIDELLRTGTFRTWNERNQSSVIDAGSPQRHAKTERVKQQPAGVSDVSACASDYGDDPLQPHALRSSVALLSALLAWQFRPESWVV